MSSKKMIKRAEHHVLNFTFPFLQKAGGKLCDLNPFSWPGTEFLVIYCVSIARSGLHHISLHSRVIGEGNGNPLQYSCLENPRDGRAAGDLGSISGSGSSPGEGNDSLLQYSCLENPMDRGAW